ncbi:MULTISPECIES: hypothetical protein [Methylobacterium]|uniref:hypothetical protein n=1 Tax=Methylobacterium TaxID=407 RepID=UPI0013EA7549|nr:hypothetical protein [Methylobacterium sp. DB0501]NGM38108.1 hypothetical protein [Methylobacterium sp. DB0501]
MRAVLNITTRVTLPVVSIATITAIYILPSGITGGDVGPWLGLMSMSGLMIMAGAAAWFGALAAR